MTSTLEITTVYGLALDQVATITVDEIDDNDITERIYVLDLDDIEEVSDGVAAFVEAEITEVTEVGNFELSDGVPLPIGGDLSDEVEAKTKRLRRRVA